MNRGADPEAKEQKHTGSACAVLVASVTIVAKLVKHSVLITEDLKLTLPLGHRFDAVGDQLLLILQHLCLNIRITLTQKLNPVAVSRMRQTLAISSSALRMASSMEIIGVLLCGRAYVAQHHSRRDRS